MKAVRPEDVISDAVNSVEFNGVNVRKGTVGAILANAKILAAHDSTVEEKTAAKAMIKELAPAVIASGLHEHVTWNNPEIQNILDDVVKAEK